MKSTLRSALISAAAATLVITTAGLADADTLALDGDQLSGPASVDLGDVCVGGPAKSEGITATVKRAGNGNVFAEDASVTISAAASAGASLETTTIGPLDDWVHYSASTGNITNDDNGETYSSTPDVTVLVPAGTTPGSYSTTLDVVSSGPMAAGSNPPSASISVSWTAITCTPANAAPTVISGAADPAAGPEGSALSTGGAFADDGGAGNLTITMTGGEGSLTLPAVHDGTWTWNHTPDDNFSDQVVTVRATDEDGEYVEDEFVWTSTNADPVVGPVVTPHTDACSVDLSAAFTDQGSADTHTAGILWGDEPAGTVVTLAADTSPVTGSHTYQSAGTYTATVTVRDDDAGVGTADGSAFTAHNTPSSILQPINTGGTRSSFKIGSTIPVKITVTGCDGNPVTTLTPTVNLQQEDTNVDATVNETVISEQPTNGKAMRWDGSQYIYNLSTKNSQFNGGGSLTTGTYLVSVSDPTFSAAARSLARFDVRK